MNLLEFNNLLDELSDALSYRVNKIIFGGDFNAKANLWGSNSTDKKEFLLTKWAAERDLRIANLGEKPTCVRPQGSSIVDLTWVSPDLVQCIRDWRVEDEVESLSDHLYIVFNIHSGGLLAPLNRSLSRMWSCKRLDKDLFYAVLYWRGLGPTAEILDSIDGMIDWFD